MKKPYTVAKLNIQKGRDWWTIDGPDDADYPPMDHATATDLCDRLNGAYSEGLREGAQGIVKEGPSVEDIMEVVRECAHPEEENMGGTMHETGWLVVHPDDLRKTLSSVLSSEEDAPKEEQQGKQLTEEEIERLVLLADSGAYRRDDGVLMMSGFGNGYYTGLRRYRDNFSSGVVAPVDAIIEVVDKWLGGRECLACDGTGVRIGEGPCSQCGGNGTVLQDHEELRTLLSALFARVPADTKPEQSEDAALPDGRWIPVSERLPDPGNQYLIVIAATGKLPAMSTTAYYGSFEPDADEKQDPDYARVTWRPIGRAHVTLDHINITHWMPLPTPPTN